jgi:hypothetical protein
MIAQKYLLASLFISRFKQQQQKKQKLQQKKTVT